MSESETKQAQSQSANSDFTSVLEQKNEASRPEISGAAIARMMGVATSTELKLLEGKLDLITSRINHMSVRIDKIMNQFSSLPTGSDLERIDVQLGSLKSIIRDLSVVMTGGTTAPKAEASNKPSETEIVEPTEEAAAE